MTLGHAWKTVKFCMNIASITSWQMAWQGEKVEAVTIFIFLDFKITLDSDCSCEIKSHLPLEGRV